MQKLVILIIYLLTALNLIIFCSVIFHNGMRNVYQRYAQLRKQRYEPLIQRLIAKDNIRPELVHPLLPGDGLFIASLLIDLLEHFGGQVRMHIIGYLEQTGYVQRCIRQLHTHNQRKLFRAIQELGIIGSDDAQKELSALLAYPHDDIKRATIFALAKSASPAMIGKCMKQLPRTLDLTMVSSLLSFGTILDSYLLHTKETIPRQAWIPYILLSHERKLVKTYGRAQKMYRQLSPTDKKTVQHLLPHLYGVKK